MSLEELSLERFVAHPHSNHVHAQANGSFDDLRSGYVDGLQGDKPQVTKGTSTGPTPAPSHSK